MRYNSMLYPVLGVRCTTYHRCQRTRGDHLARSDSVYIIHIWHTVHTVADKMRRFKLTVLSGCKYWPLNTRPKQLYVLLRAYKPLLDHDVHGREWRQEDSGIIPDASQFIFVTSTQSRSSILCRGLRSRFYKGLIRKELPGAYIRYTSMITSHLLAFQSET